MTWHIIYVKISRSNASTSSLSCHLLYILPSYPWSYHGWATREQLPDFRYVFQLLRRIPNALRLHLLSPFNSTPCPSPPSPSSCSGRIASDRRRPPEPCRIPARMQPSSAPSSKRCMFGYVLRPWAARRLPAPLVSSSIIIFFPPSMHFFMIFSIQTINQDLASY